MHRFSMHTHNSAQKRCFTVFEHLVNNTGAHTHTQKHKEKNRRWPVKVDSGDECPWAIMNWHCATAQEL